MLKKVCWVVAVVLTFSWLEWPGPVYVSASVDSCSASVSPSTLTAGTSATLDFQIHNDTGPSAVWVQILRPEHDYTVTGATASGWSDDTSIGGTTLTGGSLDAAGDMDIQLALNASASPDYPNYAGAWNVQISDDPGGAGATTCLGDLATAITPASSNPAPYIYNVAASDVTTSTVTISWSTDIPSTSQVQYGLTTSYDNTSQLDSSFETNHSQTLTGLNSNTGYHFQVTSTSQDSVSANSGDSTFLTATRSVDNNGGGSGLLGLPAPAGTVPTLPVAAEHVPPTVSLTSTIENPYKTNPKLTGTATDNVAVARVDYSLDGGKNWTVVTDTPGIGGTSVDFSFSLDDPQDGNYQLELRAIDTSGNISTTAPVLLVLDTAPPQVGGVVFSEGPQVLQPDANGVVTVPTGVDTKVTTTATGGATLVQFLAQPLDGGEVTNQFALTQNLDAGWWSGVMSFTRAGTYQVVAHSKDGAGNITNRKIFRIRALPTSSVVSSATGLPVAAKATLYFRGSGIDSWTLWDGSAYGQSNPQTATKGKLGWLIPPGTYYFKLQAPGYRPLISRIFTLTSSLALTTPLTLDPATQFNLGPLKLTLPNWSVKTVTVDTAIKAATASAASSLVGQYFPNFALADTDGSTKTELGVTGKPTLVTVLSSWEPTTSEQIAALTVLQSNRAFNIIPIFTQDDLSKVSGYLAASGQNLTAVADPSGSLVVPLSIGSLPEHFIIDRSGHIKMLMVGVLSNSELQDALTGVN